MPRPKNPYKTAPWGAITVPAKIDAWLRGHQSSRANGSPPTDDFYKDLPAAISAILENDLPRVQRYIIALLLFEYGVRPDDIRGALKASGLLCTPLPVKTYPKDANIWSYGRKPTNTEVGALRTMYERFRDDLDTKRYGKTAELYVFRLLNRSRAYERANIKLVGEYRDSQSKNKVDIVMVRREDGKKFAISVKNIRDFIGERHRAIHDVIKMAKAHDAAPWLIASYWFPEAKTYAVRNGVRWSELGRQILPYESQDGRDLRKVVEGVRHIVGPTKYDFVPQHRLPAGITTMDPTKGIGLDAWTLPVDAPHDPEIVAEMFRRYGVPV